MGLTGEGNANNKNTNLAAYAGIDAAETNVAGTGITLGGAVGLAREQLALRVDFSTPRSSAPSG